MQAHTDLHACEVHGLVHQDPRGRLKARRDGHRSVVCDKTTRLGVNVLDIQACQKIRVICGEGRGV